MKCLFFDSIHNTPAIVPPLKPVLRVVPFLQRFMVTFKLFLTYVHVVLLQTEA